MKSLLDISLEEFYQIRADEAREDGLEEGLAKGRKEEKLESARKMKAWGDPVKKIAAVTGLSPYMIKKL
ncbi:MAG: hypothetical protein FWG35_00835 [Spirochaetaceae bacterium]|nr:hypothetical protein [Spirochaetaceae bacterium]